MGLFTWGRGGTNPPDPEPQGQELVMPDSLEDLANQFEQQSSYLTTAVGYDCAEIRAKDMDTGEMKDVAGVFLTIFAKPQGAPDELKFQFFFADNNIPALWQTVMDMGRHRWEYHINGEGHPE